MKSLRFVGISILTGCMMLGIFALSVAAQESDEPYGSNATIENKEYSIEEMLRYAIEDEYVAQAEYLAIIQSFGDARPFSTIVEAEGTHINMLLPLFDTYQIELPNNDAKEYISLPETLEAAYTTGVEAEIKNIAMYEKFLTQDLPTDIRTVFEYLKDASNNHLNAFQRNVDRSNGVISQTNRGNVNALNDQIRGTKGKGRNR